MCFNVPVLKSIPTEMNTPTPGYADVVIGTQYGDEGKARVIDDMAAAYDIIARFNGGSNAGHTVEAQGIRLALRQVPSAVLYPDKILYVGSGCVIDVEQLKEETDTIKGHGIILSGRLKFSSQAGLVQPHHKIIDAIIGGTIGTTKNGIGPAYADRAIRMHENQITNIRLGDVLDAPEKFLEAIKQNYYQAAAQYRFADHGLEIDIDAKIKALKTSFDEVKEYIEMDTLFLQKRCEAGAKILFEGAQSFMLDVNKGSVPYVTSSPTNAAAAYSGGDLPPKYHRKTIGVAKAVMSRVGYGPFTSEMGGTESEQYCMKIDAAGVPVYNRDNEKTLDPAALIGSDFAFEMGQAFRIYSREYGTVTGRPRRVGHLDLVQLGYAIAVNGIDEIVLTKCDLLLHYVDTAGGDIPLVTKYMLDGKEIDYVPGATNAYGRVEPGYETVSGFSQDVGEVKEFSNLPETLQSLIGLIEQKTNCAVRGVSVGPNRSQYIPKENA